MLSSFLVQWLNRLHREDWELFFPSARWAPVWKHISISWLILFNTRLPTTPSSSGLPGPPTFAFHSKPCIQFSLCSLPTLLTGQVSLWSTFRWHFREGQTGLESTLPPHAAGSRKALHELCLPDLSSPPCNGYRTKAFLLYTFYVTNSIYTSNREGSTMKTFVFLSK